MATSPVRTSLKWDVLVTKRQGLNRDLPPGREKWMWVHLVLPEELKGNVIDLEGRDLIVVEVGHTDTDYTTFLHVPSVGLVVAGDAAYNDVHLYLAESNAQTRREWITALDTIETLRPRAVIAGHKKADRSDSPGIIEETRQYIRDFERVADMTTTARELYDKMLELYPDR